MKLCVIQRPCVKLCVIQRLSVPAVSLPGRGVFQSCVVIWGRFFSALSLSVGGVFQLCRSAEALCFGYVVIQKPCVSVCIPEVVCFSCVVTRRLYILRLCVTLTRRGGDFELDVIEEAVRFIYAVIGRPCVPASRYPGRCVPAVSLSGEQTEDILDVSRYFTASISGNTIILATMQPELSGVVDYPVRSR